MSAHAMRLVSGGALPTVADDFRHEGYPLTVLLRAKRGFIVAGEADEVERAVRERPSIDVVVEAAADGIVLYGPDEDALQRVVARLVGFRWRHLVAQPPEVRFRGPPLRVPWMQVNVRTSRKHAALLRAELYLRGATLHGGHYSGERAMLSCVAPLTGLLGFPAWLAQHTDRGAVVTQRLVEWRPVHDDPDPPGPLAA